MPEFQITGWDTMNISVRMTAGEFAAQVNGEMSDPGLASLEICGFQTLEAAGEQDLSFVSDTKHARKALESKARILTVPRDVKLEGKPLIRVQQVWKAVLKAMELFHSLPESEPEIHPAAVISPDAVLGANLSVGPGAVIESGAEIGDNCIIAAFCYIGIGTKIGSNCLLHPRVTIMRDCIIGNRVILHPGAVIGSDGFKYEVIDGLPTKIPQVGRVIIEDDAEIGANTCIDRAFLTETRIGRGCKLDNLIQIGHNVQLGPYCLMAAQVGIAGSTRLGMGCILGGQVGVRDNITLGDGVMVAAQSGLSKDIPPGKQVFGTPAVEIKEYIRREANLRHLPELIERMKEKTPESGG